MKHITCLAVLLKAVSYNYFEGVTIRNTDIAIWAGTQFIAGSKGLTVKKSRFENVNLGIFSNYSGSSDYFYNNYMTNFHDNAFEVDGSMHNVRVMRNMMVNSASHRTTTGSPQSGGGVLVRMELATIGYPGGLGRVQMLYKAEDFDFRLKPGSAAVDRGVILFNVTDGFTGQAPDLGALELGQPPAHYGPRP